MTSQPDPTATLSLEHQRESFITGQFLRIVNWHNTPETRRLTLRAELTWYLERYHPIGPDDLDRFFDTGTWHLGRPAFLPAFYDGYRNNATVAAPVCDELGLTAWFFPPTGFLDTPAEEQLAYTTTNDIILLDDEDLAKNVGTGIFQMMSNSGQSCNAPTRMLVPQQRMDEVVAAIRARDFPAHLTAVPAA